ncbi:MAG: glycosyltransferase family A protein [Acidobacteriota bacterium]
MKHEKKFSVSVIIPAYNGEKYLGEAIESVLSQSLEPMEIIVINDGSDDETYKIEKTFSGYIKYLSQDRKGLGFSRNRGIEQSNGNFTAHLDADDLWEKEKLLFQYETFKENRDVEITGGLMRSFYSPEIDIEEIKSIYCPPDPIPSFSASAIVVKKSCYKRIGFYSTGIDDAPDLEWFIRAREYGIKEIMINKILCHRRIHKSNTGIRNADTNRKRLHLLKQKLDRNKK